MRVLTIDTATTIASVGLVVDGVQRAVEAIREPAAAQHVLVAVDRVLDAADLDADGLTGIVVGRGPGSFTGLRIGLATAIGLAAPRGIALTGVATTAALRTQAGPAGVAVVDARRGEVFAEGPGLELEAMAPEGLATRLAPDAVLVGDGAIRYRAALGPAAIPDDASALHVPSPAALAALSAQGGPPTALYVRGPDAVPAGER